MKKLEQKLVPGRKYLVGPRNEEMFYHEDFLDDYKFVNRYKRKSIKAIYIEKQHLELRGTHITDKKNNYHARIVKWISPKELGEDNLGALYRKVLGIYSTTIKKKDRQAVENCRGNLFYDLESEFLESIRRKR